VTGTVRREEVRVEETIADATVAGTDAADAARDDRGRR
jgi:hypothetical protein